MKYDDMYMGFAIRASKESKCPRTQTGCCVVTRSGMIAPGFNGHAPGGPNEWEWTPDGNPEVVHAELNALGKMLEQGVSAMGATLYVTLSPCLDCAKLIVRAKIERVVYKDEYRKTDGLDYLRKYNVKVERYGERSVDHVPVRAIGGIVIDALCPGAVETALRDGLVPAIRSELNQP